LGCPKNLVDTEVMLGMLNKSGYDITPNEDDADIILINTCGFLQASVKESIRTILETSQTGKKIVMTGCLLDRYKELENELPEVSAFVSSKDLSEIVKVFDEITGKKENKKRYFDYFSTEFDVPRYKSTFSPYTYVKISEGCNHACAFCIIPQIKGDYRSRTIKSIVSEVKELTKEGINEVILIAQDLTSYGSDTDNKKENSLENLLKELVKIPNSPYYRILYTYPGTITQGLLDLIAKEEKILKYIDIPLQHSHKEILKLMKRPFDEEKIDDLIFRMKKTIPNLVIRTTFIVGFPEETEEHFQHLYNFIKKHKFDHVGVFPYSKEEGTTSFSMKNHVPHKIKQERRKKLMLLQQEILEEKNKSLIGQKMFMFVENVIEEKNKVIGRTYRDAPEIDGITTVSGTAEAGDIVEIQITKAKIYDTFGKIV